MLHSADTAVERRCRDRNAAERFSHVSEWNRRTAEEFLELSATRGRNPEIEGCRCAETTSAKTSEGTVVVVDRRFNNVFTSSVSSESQNRLLLVHDALVHGSLCKQ